MNEHGPVMAWWHILGVQLNSWERFQQPTYKRFGKWMDGWMDVSAKTLLRKNSSTLDWVKLWHEQWSENKMILYLLPMNIEKGVELLYIC